MRATRSFGKVFKCTLIGEGGVGKTSIALRYTEDRFEEDMKITIGVNFANKKIQVDGIDVTLMLWDLGGQPRFRDVVTDYFRGSKIAIAVYDATRPFSLDRLDDWVKRLKENASECEILFVGNKIDERTEDGVSLEYAQTYADTYGASVVEVSAKTGEGINEMFELAARVLLDKDRDASSPFAESME
ncbi:MAG: GTPase KRas protein [Candidatus Thorarchaeota archaeon]|nr:MAG: GTPase KRas protein [Candidatus Thorarchaeota archaeon]